MFEIVWFFLMKNENNSDKHHGIIDVLLHTKRNSIEKIQKCCISSFQDVIFKVSQKSQCQQFRKKLQIIEATFS